MTPDEAREQYEAGWRAGARELAKVIAERDELQASGATDIRASWPACAKWEPIAIGGES